MTRTSSKTQHREEAKPLGVPSIIARPRSPLHEQNWQEARPIYPCGESHPTLAPEPTPATQTASPSVTAPTPSVSKATTEANASIKSTCSGYAAQIGGSPEGVERLWDIPVEAQPEPERESSLPAIIRYLSLQDAALQKANLASIAATAQIPPNEPKQPSDAVGGDDGKSGCSKLDPERSSSSNFITCYKMPEAQSLHAISDPAKDFDETGDNQPGCSSCGGERDSSLDVATCYWEPKVPEGEESNTPSEGATTCNSGSLHSERRPALQCCAWWTGFDSPEEVFQTFSQAKETMEHFERIIVDSHSLRTREYLGHLVDTVPQQFAPRARKALVKKYLAAFEWITEEDAERMAQETLEWAWLEKVKAVPQLLEEDVIRCFELKSLVEGESWACGDRGWWY